MIEYIREKQSKSLRIYGVPIVIRDQTSVNLQRIIDEVVKLVPQNAFRGLKQIIVTDMRKVGNGLPFNAYYINNVIYVSNQQDGTLDAVDDIVHEMSHHLEKYYSNLIYGDKSLENEFKSKRELLYDNLVFHEMNPLPEIKTDLNYNEKVDNYFYNQLGAKIGNFIHGIFIDDYSVTSLKEYYGTGFEKYLMSYNNQSTIKKQCPILYSKIDKLIKVINGEESKE